MADRSHLSIGEVLSLLREEFPDVTISKIRFLESQGLVDPERTPSGYRKFYDHDVDRLRWILRQQRENFLPLKVIKGRLSDEDSGGLDSPAGVDPSAPAASTLGGVSTDGGAEPAPWGAGSAPRGPGSGSLPDMSGSAGVATSPAPDVPAAHAGTSATPLGDAPAPAPEVRPRPEPAAAPTAASGPTRTPVPDEAGEDESFTLEELGARCGLAVEQVEELAKFGLINVQARSGGLDYYDREALSIAFVAAGFARHGVEARHLRAWRNAAEREVSVFEQVVLPQLRQRNPQARAQAHETLDELAELGSTLRAVLVRRGTREVR